jgi:hypothetical protein
MLFTLSYSQTTIITDSIINKYQRIISIHSASTIDKDSVKVDDASVFYKNQIAMVIVNKGAEIRVTGPGQGNIENLFNTGKYALIYIDTVDYLNNLVIFNSTLPGITALNSGEKAQLITVPRYKNLIVNATLTSKAWDSASCTGGVLAFLVDNMLELNANIQVSGKGFLGADPGLDLYEGSCSNLITGYSDSLFTISAKDSSGLRGEGIAPSSYPYPRGFKAVGNSGAGGNGRYSGGGGGSNAGSGGKGGDESNICPLPGSIGGGGIGTLRNFYSNSGTYENRIFMGGGGGTSTQNIPDGYRASKGGNGGGIIVFSANRVKSNGFKISANGGSVTDIATAGAGGGGGGGVILADVVVYSELTQFEVNGGHGGKVQSGPNITGPGAGGGGGVFWHNAAVPTPPNTSSSVLLGNPGNVDGSSNKYGAESGAFGERISGLVLPRRGFLVNKIPDDQTICEDNQPNPLLAPLALGGNNGPYTYKWIKSEISPTGPWIPADGVNNQPDYAPPVLSDTTYYSRVISDGSLIDTSFAVMIAVHPKLLNNNFSVIDTICENLSAGELSFPSGMTGGLGTGSYQYTWQKSADGIAFFSADGAVNASAYNTPLLFETIYFRRKVESGACTDTSNAFKLHILPALANNTILADQIICSGQVPAGLSGSDPSGGLAGDRRYIWESSNDQTNWNAEVSTEFFSPGILSQNTSYRRTVHSGPNNTCENISAAVSITVLPIIADNQILHQDTVLCANLPALDFYGSQPTGGDGNYKYIWEKRKYDINVWTSSAELSTPESYSPGILSDSTWLRRVVKSGAGDVCQNSSDSIFISVIPAVSNNVIASSQLICENTLPDPLSGSTPLGGTGSYLYKWQKSPNGVDAWIPANPAGESINYSPEIMLFKTFFRRDVFSGPDNTCSNISNTIEIDIQAAISNNFLINGSQISSCYNVQPEAVQGSGSLTGGDGTIYNFLWQESNNMILWSPGSQVNSLQDYQPQALTDSIYLRRIVSSGLCRDTTEILKVKINPLPQISSLTSNASGTSICEDENVSLLYTINAGSSPYNLKFTDNVSVGQISASLTSNSGSIPVAFEGGSPSYYKFILTELVDANACKASDVNLSSFLIELEVFKAANPRIGMADTVEVCGNTVQLNALFPDAGNGIWRASNGIVSIADPSNLATQASFNLSPYNKITSHFYYVESTPGCGEKMDSVIVVFYEQPEDAVITTQSASSPFVVFLSDNITITSLPPSAGSGNWSINQGSAIISAQTDSSAFVTNLEIDQETNVVYSIINGVCELKSASLLIERKDVKIYQGFSPNGDGVNDFLFAEGIDKSGTELSYTFTIFNNSGAFIRELSEKDIYPGEINAIWDGIASNGKLSAEGTYYYIFQVSYKGNVLKPYKNFFVIKSE